MKLKAILEVAISSLFLAKPNEEARGYWSRCLLLVSFFPGIMYGILTAGLAIAVNVNIFSNPILYHYWVCCIGVVVGGVFVVLIETYTFETSDRIRSIGSPRIGRLLRMAIGCLVGIILVMGLLVFLKSKN